MRGKHVLFWRKWQVFIHKVCIFKPHAQKDHNPQNECALGIFPCQNDCADQESNSCWENKVSLCYSDFLSIDVKNKCEHPKNQIDGEQSSDWNNNFLQFLLFYGLNTKR